MTHDAPSLSALHCVELAPPFRRLLDDAMAGSTGSAMWKARKQAELTDVLALAQLAPHRLAVRQAAAVGELRVVVELRAPAPVLPMASGALETAPAALLGLRYPEAAMTRPQPGYAFVEVLAPLACWHPNVRAAPPRMICLGVAMPVGVRCSELLLAAYRALTLQELQPDERDPAGVLNRHAALWYQRNPTPPLTREPFLGGRS